MTKTEGRSETSPSVMLGPVRGISNATFFDTLADPRHEAEDDEWGKNPYPPAKGVCLCVQHFPDSFGELLQRERLR